VRPSLVFRFQAIIPHIAEGGDADVPDGQPALQFVMAGAMEDVGNPYRGHGACGFKTGEPGRVVDHVVGQQDFLPAAPLKVAGGSVIHAAHYGDSGE